MTQIQTTDAREAVTAAALPAAGEGRAASWKGGLLQRTDPRLRITLAAAFALTAVSLKGVALLMLTLALALLLATLAQLPAKRTLRRMLAMDAFMVPVLVFLPFTVVGDAIVAFGPLTVSAAGVERALAIVLTANAVVLAVFALVGTIEPVILGHALLSLGASEKVVRMLLLTIRYVALLHLEYGRLRVAMKARGFIPAGNLHTWKSYGYLFGMLLVRSFERSERIVAAMKCRGFSGRFLAPEWPPLCRVDRIFAATATAVLLLLAIGGHLEWTHL